MTEPAAAEPRNAYCLREKCKKKNLGVNVWLHTFCCAVVCVCVCVCVCVRACACACVDVKAVRQAYQLITDARPDGGGARRPPCVPELLVQCAEEALQVSGRPHGDEPCTPCHHLGFYHGVESAEHKVNFGELNLRL